MNSIFAKDVFADLIGSVEQLQDAGALIFIEDAAYEFVGGGTAANDL